MKKRNNKIIALILAGIIFVVLLGIFILNYSKDDSSFSLLEKKWLNDNTNNVLDVSVYNDIPIYGKNGSGVIFDFLDDFTIKYGINFNKVSYSSSNPKDLKPTSFQVVSNNTTLTDKDILLYEDYYVLVSSAEKTIDYIRDIEDINIMVLEDDIGLASNYLEDAKNVSFTPKKNIDDIKSEFPEEDDKDVDTKEAKYALIPYNMYVDFILENNLNIIFHLTDISKKYILKVEDKTLLNIMKKYYLQFKDDVQSSSYKENFLNEFFADKKISEADRMEYNASPYNVGYINYMPFESEDDGKLVGNLSNYINGFESLFDVDFQVIYYDSIEKLRQDFSSGKLDVVFANFSTDNLNIDIIHTPSLFKEEYVVLSKDNFTINSIKGLSGYDIKTIKNSYLDDLASANNIKAKVYNNTDSLLRSSNSSSIIVIDKDTYNYYKNSKFGNYNIVYSGILPYEYDFAIRDVNKNAIFSQMLSYYVSSISYESIKYQYNTNEKIDNFNLIAIFSVVVVIVLILFLVRFIFKRKKVKDLSSNNNDNKLRYIDTMTSLKNRTYLNAKIKEWDDNVIYPQAFVVVDLNNIKYINDNKGHEEGDTVIKKAASILIVNQEANTDIIRTDGNEFLIYMVGYSEKDVVAYTRKIYKDLKELPYGFGAAIGYSMIMDDVKTVDDAINEATLDMRNRKENM